MGVNCNRAVSFAPHGQKNYDVHVTQVVARSCHQGVIESADESLGAAARGGFWDSTMNSVAVVGGLQAQDPVQLGGSAGAWKIGASVQSFARDAKATWDVVFSNLSCQGPFPSPANPIMIGATRQVPTCQ
jgi:hypothetical protein